MGKEIFMSKGEDSKKTEKKSTGQDSEGKESG
jgi:hypothetical protein